MAILGNPEEQAPLSITSTVQEITLTQGLASIEFQNTGTKDVYYGKRSTLTSSRGGIIYGNGDRKSFENIPSGWKISFLTKSGETSTLRQINYV